MTFCNLQLDDFCEFANFKLLFFLCFEADSSIYTVTWPIRQILIDEELDVCCIDFFHFQNRVNLL